MQAPDTTIALLDASAAQAAQYEGLDAVMLAHGRMPVVAAVVAVVWLGILVLLFRTDRRLARVERELQTLDD